MRHRQDEHLGAVGTHLGAVWSILGSQTGALWNACFTCE